MSHATLNPPKNPSLDDGSTIPGFRQFLTFTLANEDYGVDILQVQEIKGYTTVTQIPHLPSYFKGVLNLRGAIIPIVDLRLKFGMGPTELTSFTVIVVVNIGSRITGILVDAVSDVLDIAPKAIHSPPELGQRIDVAFMEGIATSQDRLVTLLNLRHALSEDELAQVCDEPGNIDPEI